MPTNAHSNALARPPTRVFSVFLCRWWRCALPETAGERTIDDRATIRFGSRLGGSGVHATDEGGLTPVGD